MQPKQRTAFGTVKNMNRARLEDAMKIWRDKASTSGYITDPADKAAHDRMVEMVDTMLELHKRKAAATSDALTSLETRIAELDAAIDALVYELYGLTEEEIKIVEGSVS